MIRPAPTPPVAAIQVAPAAVALEQDADPDLSLTPHEHDLVVRYSLLAITTILLTAALSVTREISLPLAAGIVFGMVLGPAVDWLAARTVPPALAAGVIVAMGLILLAAAAAVLTIPVSAVGSQLPQMVGAMQAKFLAINGAFRQFLHLPADDPGSNSAAKLIGGWVSSLPLAQLAAVSTAALAELLVFFATLYFYLATRRHIKAQALRLCLGRKARKSAGHFFERIENQVASYLGLVTVINLCCGSLAFGIAWSAGMPYPIFWGALAAVLNYLYVIGPITIIALLLAARLMTVDTGWAAIWPAASYLMVHLIESNLVTPHLVGNRLTLSPFLVFISFVFWLWLWGPVGAVLATPILIVAMLSYETLSAYHEAVAAGSEAADDQSSNIKPALPRVQAS